MDASTLQCQVGCSRLAALSKPPAETDAPLLNCAGDVSRDAKPLLFNLTCTVPTAVLANVARVKSDNESCAFKKLNRTVEAVQIDMYDYA